jgi:hypothetical protein
LRTYLPQLRIRDTGFIHVYGVSGLNYYAIGNMVPDSNNDANGTLTPLEVLTPREALGIDEKVDDGVPARGIMISLANDTTLATNTTAANGAASPAAGECYDSDAPTNYATASEDVANSIGCVVRIRTGF